MHLLTDRERFSAQVFSMPILKADAVIVLEDGKPEGVVTRQDLLGYLTA